jgi:hypothetical protein
LRCERWGSSSTYDLRYAGGGVSDCGGVVGGLVEGLDLSGSVGVRELLMVNGDRGRLHQSERWRETERPIFVFNLSILEFLEVEGFDMVGSAEDNVGWLGRWAFGWGEVTESG